MHRKFVKLPKANGSAEGMTDKREAIAGMQRRPIRARDSRWAKATARWLTHHDVTPNAISLASVGFTLISALALLLTRENFPGPARAMVFVLGILAIQGRLLCNLFDGMVALEAGRAGKLGEIFNDLPDRFADPLILVATGYAAGGAWGAGLGWLAALLAMMTAYVRVLGRSLGSGIYFIGPMAKQHRMATLSFAFAIAAILAWADLGQEWTILIVALAVIDLGCVITIARRLWRIRADLEAR